MGVTSTAFGQANTQDRQNQERQNQGSAQNQDRQNATSSPASTTVQAGSLDYFLVSCLENGNEAEIELSKLAEQRASHRDVKEFAQKMVKEHGELLQSLQQISGSSGRRSSSDSSRTSSTSQSDRNEQRDARQADSATQRPATQPGASSATSSTSTQQAGQQGQHASASQLAQIQDEVAEQCVSAAKRELSQKESTEFDKAYIGMALGAHHQMLSELTVFRKHASPRLQPVLDKGIQATQHHLDEAKRIYKELESSREPETARRTERRE